MGKRLIQQARGKGGPAYCSRSFAFVGDVRLRPLSPSAIPGRVIDLVNCPGHSAPLMEVQYEDKLSCLLPAPEFIRVGDVVEAGPGSEPKVGNTLTLRDVPEGTLVFNIESHPGDGGRFCRTSGSSARLVSKTDKHAVVILPSKKEKKFHLSCRACVGVVAGSGRKEKPLLKAGKTHFAKRAKNKHWPNPRGSAMNAVDHPFGNTRSARKANQKAASKFAPPGRKVGKLWPKRTGKRK